MVIICDYGNLIGRVPVYRIARCPWVVLPDQSSLLLFSMFQGKKLQRSVLESGLFFSSFFHFLYILPDPLLSIIGRCTLYTQGCRMKAYK